MTDLRSPLGQTDGTASDATSGLQKLNIGHQEIDRIVDEVEQIYGSQPMEWLTVAPIGNMIVTMHDWYEDFDEFEDACGGSFEDFLRLFPQFELRAADDGRAEFKVLKPDADSPPMIMTLRVTQQSDLWRVLFKSPDAAIRIPHLEFEIGADNKRRIDTVYNHITNAVWNLSSHLRAQSQGGGEVTGDAAAILETVDALEALLDVDEPFDIVVDDATGTSLFKPAEGVEIVEL